MICKDYNELRQQFVLINNTRPLPKALIYELLPTVDGLPDRYTARSFASKMVERLNYDSTSSLRGQIYQHTNPDGIIRDTSIQKIVMNSSSDGLIRDLVNQTDFEDRTFSIINNYFTAVQEVFADDWDGMTPRTSRLVHGAGIVAMGYVMEVLYARGDAHSVEDFSNGLQCLRNVVHWREGTWKFSEDDERAWNAIQNTSGDITTLSNHLVRIVKRKLRVTKRKLAKAA